MPFHKKTRILVAPLDWGLGHTTRCMPVIKALLNNNAEVVLAGNEVQQKILNAEFPECTFLPLEGYGVAYSRNKPGFAFKIIQQLPRISAVIQRENAWLSQLVSQGRIDGVISDNRYGLYHAKLPTVFITHQLRIKTGLGRLADDIAQIFNYRYIDRFSRVWVPDYEGPQNLGGQLSHPASMPAVAVSYVGPLSRVGNGQLKNKKPEIVIILSGPEPQRSIFEQKVFEQLNATGLAVTVIRGMPLQHELPVFPNASVYNHLLASEMESILQSASFIVCRSGYSSVMDINALAQRSILIPTPGQAEQEYLAQYLMERQFALSGDQRQFDLVQLLQEAEQFSYKGFIPPQASLLTTAVEAFLADCAANGR